MLKFEHINRVKERTRVAGNHFFDADTMRFFNSYTAKWAYLTRDAKLSYFVTSERYSYQEPRMYTVRVQDTTTGEIDTIGDFNTIPTSKQAHALAKRLAKEAN